MAILLAYIETEPDPKHARPVSDTETYTKIRTNRKIATAPHEVVTDGPPTVPPPACWVREPDTELRDLATITRPAGRKIVAPNSEELDPITAFNTRFNSRRFASSCLASVTKSKEKRRVMFAKKLDIIPPVCTDLVLYREHGPDSFRLNTETRGLRRVFWSGLWIVGLLAMKYLSPVFLGSSPGFFGMDFLKAFLV